MKNKLLYLILSVVLMFAAAAVTAGAAVFGDADGSGEVDAADARIALRYSVGLEAEDSKLNDIIDVDHNRTVDAADARMILRVSVSIEKFSHGFGEYSIKKQASCTKAGEGVYTCSCGYETKTEIPPLGHYIKHYDWKIIKDATCTEPGMKTGRCRRCLETVEAEIPAKGHSPGSTFLRDKAPTCTEAGLKVKKCKVCKEIVETEEIPPLGHDFFEPLLSIPPTCTNDGLKTQRCARCNFVKEIHDEDTKPTGHSWDDKKTAVILPTCTEKGMKAYRCQNENCTAVMDEEEIPPLGHDMLEPFTVLSPTCTEKGETRSNCRRCSYYEINEIPAPGHDFKETYIAPTCTEEGYSLFECQSENCGYSEKRNIEPAKGHNFIKDESRSTVPDCVNAGKDIFVCSVCHAEKTAEIPASGHNFIYNEEKSYAASCEKAGLEVYTCKNCGLNSYKQLPASGHTETVLPAKEPTCTEAGLTEGRKCSVCGSVLVRQQVIPEKGHSFGEWTVDKEPVNGKPGTQHRICTRCGFREDMEFSCIHNYNISKTPADCTKPGINTYTCTLCGYTYEEIYEQALGHDYENTVTPPDCTNGGFTTHTCKRCKDTYIDSEVPPAGHKVIERNAAAPTCEEAGKEPDLYCETCGKLLRKGAVIKAAGHIEPADFEILSTSTCSVHGRAVKVCEREGCGKVLAEKELPLLPHSTEAQKYEYSEKGDVRTKKCIYCGEVQLTENACAAFINADGSVKEYIFDFEKAVNSSVSGDVIRLIPGYTLKSDITVNKGVTLIVPCRDNDRGYDEDGYNPDGTSQVSPYEDLKKLYAEFTVPEGVKINVFGTLLVNAVTGRKVAGSNTTYDVSGGYGKMNLEGTVDVMPGGIFDCSGFVEGRGTLTLEDGAKMYETYAMVKWRGGTQSVFVIAANQFPVLESAMNNMRAHLVIKSGAELMGTVKACATKEHVYYYFAERFVIFSQKSGIIRLKDGAYCERDIIWDESLTSRFYGETQKGALRDVYKFHGGADFNASSLSVQGYSMATDSVYYYVFDGDMSFEFYEGDYNILRGFRFLPGFIIKAGEGASINIKNNGETENIYKIGKLLMHGESYAEADQEYMHYVTEKGVEVNSETARYPLGRGASFIELLPGSVLNAEAGCTVAGKIIKHENTVISIDEKAHKAADVIVFQGMYNSPDSYNLHTVLDITEAQK